MWPVVGMPWFRVSPPAQNYAGYPTILLRIGCVSLARRYNQPFHETLKREDPQHHHINKHHGRKSSAAS